MSYSKEEVFDCVIIGGGASGLIAAQELPGKKVLILEAREEVGGRIRRFKDAPSHDAGAAWIHGTDAQLNPVMQRLDKENIVAVSRGNFWCESSLMKEEAIVYDLRHNRVCSKDQLACIETVWRNTMAQLEETAAAANEMAALGPALGRKAAQSIHAKLLELWMGEGVQYLQLREFAEQGSYGDHQGNHALLKGGMAQILDALKVPEHCRILLDKAVLGITVSSTASNDTTRNRIVTIKYHDRKNCTISTVAAHTALITLPLGILKQLPDFFFQPTLPNYKRDAISRLGVGAYAKVLLFYNSAWWRTCLNPDRKPFILLMTEDTEITKSELISFIDHDALQLGDFLLEATFAGDRARSMENLDTQAQVNKLRKVLDKAVGFRTQEPSKVLSTNWSKDPFACGAYSYWPVGALDTDIDSLAKPIPPLFWAGEATSLNFQGSLAGAILSGERAANEISDFLTSSQQSLPA